MGILRPVEYHRHLAAMAGSHKRIGLISVLQKEAMGNEILGMQAPADQALHQILHTPEAGHPAAIDGFLAMDYVGAGLKAGGAALAHIGNFAPFAGSLDSQRAAGLIGASIHSLFHAMPAGQGADKGQRILAGG